MEVRKVGIMLNGVTGRMGTNQHLERSILAIVKQGGLKVSDDMVIMPDPILTGRNINKLQAIAEKYGVEKYTTDVQAACDDPQYEIFFDSSTTQLRRKFVEMAVKAGKSVYCEKPTAVSTEEAIYMAKLCDDAGLKNGVVQDKLWLPGLCKFRMLKEQGFFGEIISVKGDFGYWVFTGKVEDQPVQRPSWNYRKEDGGGIVLDMHCHWRYVIDNLFGKVSAVSCRTTTLIDERVDEKGDTYKCTTDDTSYATFELESGLHVNFISSWNTRLRKDDLLSIQVDGTLGSAIIGLRKCLVQPHSITPKAVWNPDVDNPVNYFDQWHEVPNSGFYDNAFKIQWEKFLRYVILDEPFPWTLMEGAKGVQLAEESLRSHEEKKWIKLEDLG